MKKRTRRQLQGLGRGGGGDRRGVDGRELVGGVARSRGRARRGRGGRGRMVGAVAGAPSRGRPGPGVAERGEEARARELSMAEVDALSWQEFEEYVADLLPTRRLHEGRRQWQERRPGRGRRRLLGRRPKAGRPVQEVAHPTGAFPRRTCEVRRHRRLEHGADVALFVTTCRTFTKAAVGLALRRTSWPLHRDLLGAWVKGARLETT
ncbi:hypothetical protein LT493_11520 [Streptomyces tricolor]|nr:hypothetical protein [Streptomyces tricolor]